MSDDNLDRIIQKIHEDVLEDILTAREQLQIAKNASKANESLCALLEIVENDYIVQLKEIEELKTDKAVLRHKLYICHEKLNHG